MSRKFKLQQKYYDDNKLYNKAYVTIKPGITILVGCNGIGKTTFLRQIKDKLQNNNIPVVYFDNLHDGGRNAVSEAGFFRDYSFIASAICSSEGENIVMNLAKVASTLRHFIQTGEDVSKRASFSKIFNSLHSNSSDDACKHRKEIPNERWILLDAVDSGLSVDNIVDMKELLFKTIIEDKTDCDIYIVVSANEYELARGENCFDVYNGKYIKFNDYEDYRNFIIDSGKIKESRYKD